MVHSKLISIHWRNYRSNAVNYIHKEALEDPDIGQRALSLANSVSTYHDSHQQMLNH